MTRSQTCHQPWAHILPKPSDGGYQAYGYQKRKMWNRVTIFVEIVLKLARIQLESSRMPKMAPYGCAGGVTDRADPGGGGGSWGLRVCRRFKR